MKKIILFLTITCSFCSNVFSQTSPGVLNIEFRVISQSLSDDASVFICGNIPQLAEWNPGALKMTNTGNHTWVIKIKTGVSFPIEYKYTLGSWEKENANSNGQPLTNFIIKVKTDTIISDHVLSWLNKTERKITGQISGKVAYHRQLHGDGIADRDIIVWLPPDYEINASARYPVLYMHDGQNIFDPATSSFGTDWQIDETCDSLIKAEVINPLIVVGINNSKNRMSEYTPGNTGSNYMKFVVETVKPLIDKTYRTIPDRNHTYTGGSSAGGTISFMLAWNYPDVFSKAFCLSPAFKIQNIDLIKEVTNYKGKKQNLVFYIDNGGKGLEERLQPGVDEMINELKAKGFKENRDIFYVKAPDAEHNEAAWAKRMPEALKLLLTK
jgi:predicted alpha/beta superfamily hydrolase